MLYLWAPTTHVTVMFDRERKNREDEKLKKKSLDGYFDSSIPYYRLANMTTLINVIIKLFEINVQRGTKI